MADGRTPVDVVVPVFNSLHVVRRCLDTILRWSDAEARVVVVDDGSDQHTADVLDAYAAAHGTVEVVRHRRNLGFVQACTTGFRSVRAEAGIVVLLNSDVRVTPGWLDRVRDCFASDPRIGIGCGIASFAPHARIELLPGLDELQMAALLAATSDRRYPDITTPEGFLYAIRADCLTDTGGFDPLFDRGYGEESDLAMRANYLGWRTVLIDDLYVWHQGRATFGQAVRDELYAANKGIFHDRWGARYRHDYPATPAAGVLQELRERLDGLVASELEPGFRR